MLCLESQVRTGSFEEVKNGLNLAREASEFPLNQTVKPPPEPIATKKGDRTRAMALMLVLLLLVNGSLYGWLIAKKPNGFPNLQQILSVLGIAGN